MRARVRVCVRVRVRARVRVCVHVRVRVCASVRACVHNATTTSREPRAVQERHDIHLCAQA